MAYTPHAGSDGRVRTGAGDTITTGVTKWSFNKALETFKVTDFESTADFNSVIHEVEISSNICGTKGRLEGFFDAGTPNSESTFPIGTTVTLDLLIVKSSSLGWKNIAAIITNVGPGVDIRAAQSFTIEFTVTGVMPVAN